MASSVRNKAEFIVTPGSYGERNFKSIYIELIEHSLCTQNELGSFPCVAFFSYFCVYSQISGVLCYV